ncbi:N,N-dimethylformamidase beta subunit family domain-containing protein [Plantactinospora sp. WMMB782]|uniref:N,N-dimethylformamidase beta subunit family domain-containing protein n=1 Tax=Plantactinospora sp. WMMB782 TaxID=3404121 RepID=UPI003B955826
MADRSVRWSRRTTLTVFGAGALGALGAAGYGILRTDSVADPTRAAAWGGSAPAAASGSGGTPPAVAVRDPHYPGDAEPGPVGPAPRRASGGGPSAVSRENSRPGTAGFGTGRHRFGDDAHGQIAGYTSSSGVEIGAELGFHVSVAPAQQYRIQIYRVGHYGGPGGRLVATSPWLAGRRQPPPTVAAQTRMVHCDWPVGWRLRVGRDWVSGYYLALLTNAAGWSRWIPFVVRDPERSAAGLVVVPTSTYQAYNLWPDDGRTGTSLYRGFDPAGQPDPELRATAVCHDRPYQGSGMPRQARNDIGFVRWMEGHGYDVTYATSEDLHTGRVDPRRYWAVVFCGHDEYWTVEMRRAAAAARDAGTSLVFLAANNCYWRIRYGGADSRTSERVVECAKTLPPWIGEVPLTTQWRIAGSPEQQLLGGQYVSIVDGQAPLVVRESRHWFWAGTGVRDGDRIPRVVYGEADRVQPSLRGPRAADRVLLSDSPYRRGRRIYRQQTSLYRTDSGAWVFDAGSLGWTRALSATGFVDSRLQRATSNLLDRVLRHQPSAAVR